jgi:hypothetical protein
MPEFNEGDQMPGGEDNLPAWTNNSLDLTSTQNAIHEAYKEGRVKQDAIESSPAPSEVPHAPERLFICSFAMAICLLGAAAPQTPENIRPALLSIASVITTALVKPFEKN